MSHSPPVPEANQSPFPLKEPKHDRPDLPPILRVAKTPEAKRDLPIGTISAVLGLGAVAVGGAILGLRLWGERAKPKPKGKGRKR